MKHLLVLLALTWAAPALAGTPRASSELRDNDGNRYPASAAFDGLLQTAWAEGELGDGEGAWLELQLGSVTEVKSVSIWPGNLSGNERTLREFGRPKKVRITLSGGGGEDVVVEKHILDPSEHGPLRVDVDVAGKARTVRIDVDEVYRGGIYSDTYITEVAVNFAGGESPAAVGRLADFLGSDAGAKALEKNKEEIVGLYDQIKAAEFGDRDALKDIMDRAGDGAPFLRKQVQSQVPAGFRMQALPPDEVAIEALLKLKDSNAIPAIDRASLRTTGATSAKYAQYGSVFRAHQDLVGGASRSVPPWGETGWGKGQLQGLGEPLQIEIDNFGGIYVADTGNSRIQRFGFDGLAQRTWGAGEPGVTNTWFGSTRDHYVSGSEPSEASGGFVNPVDLAVIPGKDFDTVAALDAAGRITLIGANDAVVNSWKLPVTDPIIPGVGGEGYLVWAKKQLVAIWGNEGFVFSAEGEELGQFQIEDGVPTGAVGLKNGKLGLIFGKELVLYSTDGFRFGDILGGTVGTGFEAWDVALDEDGKLWAVTDKGRLIKYKKPGKVDFAVQVSDWSLEVPRLDVYDDIAFVTHRDGILEVDALEANVKQQLEAQDAE